MKTEEKNIARLLENDYFKSIYSGDVQTLRNIYHPGTLLFGDVKGLPYDFNYHEYLSFHKMEGRWLIVNKMISDVNQ